MLPGSRSRCLAATQALICGTHNICTDSVTVEQYKGHVNTTLCSALSLARAPAVCYHLTVSYENLYIRNTLITLHTCTESAGIVGVVPASGVVSHPARRHATPRRESG